MTRCARQFLSLTLRESKKERAQPLAAGHVRVKNAPDADAAAAAAATVAANPAAKSDSDPAAAAAAAEAATTTGAERPAYKERGTGGCFQLGGAIKQRGEQIFKQI